MTKPAMPANVAKEVLSNAKRFVLEDRYFGDAEAYWTDEVDRCIADGYKSSRGTSISVNETADYARTTFSDDIAWELMRLGHYGRYERNDTEGNDRNRVV